MRNNSVQDRRAALRERHRRERQAADAVFRLLEKEELARQATAAVINDLVDVVGKDRAADVLGLKLAVVTEYVALHRQVTSPDRNSSGVGSSDPGDAGA